MNTTLILFSLFGAVIILFSLKKVKAKHRLLSVITGISAFFAVNFICSFFESGLPLNWFTIGASGIGGIPGVILVLLLDTFM